MIRARYGARGSAFPLTSSRRKPIGANLGTDLALFPLLPTAGWEKEPIAGKLAQPAQAWLRGRMRAGARKRDGLASGTTAPLRVAALIRRFAPPSPTQERGRRGRLEICGI